MKVKSRKPSRSLRTLLMLWLILFSVVPLAFITGYSLVKYEQAIDQELAQRLYGNSREIRIIIEELEGELRERARRHATDRALVFHLSTNNISQLRDVAQRLMGLHIAQRMSIFNREGRLEVALLKGDEGAVTRQQRLETGDVFLSDNFLQRIEDKDRVSLIEFSAESSLDLIVFSKVYGSNNRLVGYMEEIIKLDRVFLDNLKKRMGLELMLYSKDGDKSVASRDDLSLYRNRYFKNRYEQVEGKLFEFNIQGTPYGFVIEPVAWGDEKFFLATGASKEAVKAVLKNVNYAFFTIVGAIVLLLVSLSLFISKRLFRPLYELIEAIEEMNPEGPPNEIRDTSGTEIGILTDSFNEMSRRVYTVQKQLRDKIEELEAANQEIRETQAKLVHAAKMAGLGQLVAGIAHELNNPISYIYSNMAHLRDYSDRLIRLVKTAEKDPKKLQSKMEEEEFEYMTVDLPKLITACEEGAQRTRDIVLGLRSFSRLEEAKVKEVDLHEGLESTIRLLGGEFKSKIKVHKKFGKIPKVLCYPSQLNQVFMNILTNACQAIEDRGDIFIETKHVQKDQRVEVIIKDTGRGMTKEIQEKIFDPFFTTKDISSGTGLGMSITYGIIQKHGGEIKLNSEPGKGTEFVISLPVKAQALSS